MGLTLPFDSKHSKREPLCISLVHCRKNPHKLRITLHRLGIAHTLGVNWRTAINFVDYHLLSFVVKRCNAPGLTWTLISPIQDCQNNPESTDAWTWYLLWLDTMGKDGWAQIECKLRSFLHISSARCNAPPGYCLELQWSLQNRIDVETSFTSESSCIDGQARHLTQL